MPEALPTAASPQKPQQAPFGSSPATGPTPNRGYEAAAAQRLGTVIKGLEEIIPLAGSQTDIGKDVLKALSILSKHVPPGSVTPAAMKNNIEQLAMRQQQNNQQMQSLKPQAPPGAGGMPPGAGATA